MRTAAVGWGAIGAIDPFTRNRNARPTLVPPGSLGTVPGSDDRDVVPETLERSGQADDLVLHPSGRRQAVGAHEADAHAALRGACRTAPGRRQTVAARARSPSPTSLAFASSSGPCRVELLGGHLGAQRAEEQVGQRQQEVEVGAERHVVDVVVTIEEREPRLGLHDPMAARPMDRVVHDDEQVRHDGGGDHQAHEERHVTRHQPRRQPHDDRTDRHVPREVREPHPCVSHAATRWRRVCASRSTSGAPARP